MRLAARALAHIAGAFLLYALSGIATAQTTTVGEIQNAANRSGDKSMAMLEMVFGDIVHNPLSSSGGAGGGMLASMFLVITSCILALGIIWAMYQFASSMIATGQDGEFLGQKKSSSWFVIRMCIGFCSLVPIFGGYCGAQVVMLWGTMMGVGIANMTQDATVAVLRSGGSMVATPPSPAASGLANALFEANLCGESINTAIDAMPAEAGVSADTSERFSPRVSSKTIAIVSGRGQSCGGASLSMPEPVSMSAGAESIAGYGLDTEVLHNAMSSAHQAGLSAMQSTLSSLARQYVAAVDGGSAPPDVSSQIKQAASAYENTIKQAIAGSRGNIESLSSKIEQNLKRDGWVMTGAWYQTFAQANAQASALVNATASGIAGSDPANLAYPQLYRKVLAAYQEQKAMSALAGGASSDPVAALKTGSTDAKGVIASIFSTQEWVKFAISLNGNNGAGGTTNPMIGMKNLGDSILSGGWAALGVYTGMKAAQGMSESTGGKVVGAVADVATLGLAGAIKGALMEVLNGLAPFIVIAVLSLFFFGAMLSIYIPMVPFIIWFGGVTSWYAVVGEALIASPLWGVTHLDGDGEGMGQRSTHGYIFLLNVLFRPALMMVGFAVGGGGVIVLGTLLNTMFGVAMANAQFDSTTGLVSIIGFIALYVSMCLALIHSCFNLIHVVPDQVFSWIGGQMSGQVGRDTDDKAKQVFVGGLSVGKDAGRSSIGPRGGGQKSPASQTPKGVRADHLKG